MEKKTKRLKLLIILGITLLLIGTLLFFKYRYGNGNDSSESTSIASYLPIWIAVFPAMLANRNNQDKELNSKERKLALFFGITTAIMVIVTIVYLIVG